MRDPVLTRRARSLRTRGTDAERRLWHHLRLRQLHGLKFRRQVSIAGYVADFACLEAKLIVELDGGQHLEQTDYDARRDAALASAGFRVLRFWNDDVLLRTEAVLEAIVQALSVRGPHPGLPPQAGEGDHPHRPDQTGEDP
jgi:adenine-specific DNA-methyltransferase